MLAAMLLLTGNIRGDTGNRAQIPSCIAEETNSAPRAPSPSDISITLFTPDGGENWSTFGKFNITGIIQYGASPFHLTLNYTATGKYGTWHTIVAGLLFTTASFQYSWQIPDIMTSRDCYVSAFAYDKDKACAGDVSGSNFTIWHRAGSDPSVTINSPAGDENWTAGCTHTIDWSASGGLLPLKVQLEYKVGSCPYALIIKDMSNSGSYAWAVPSINSTKCYVRVTVSDASVSPHTNSSVSNNFTIWGGSSVPCPDIARIDVSPSSQVLQVGTSLVFKVVAYDKDGNEVNASFSWKVSNPALGNIAVDGSNSVRFIAKTVTTGELEVNATFGGETSSASAKIKVTSKTPVIDRVTVAPVFWIGRVGAKKEFTAHGWTGSYEVTLEYCVWDILPHSIGTLVRTGDYTVVMTADSDGDGTMYAGGIYNATERQGTATIHIDSTRAGEIPMLVIWIVGGIILVSLGVAVSLHLALRTKRKKDKDKILREWSEVLAVMKKRRCPKCNTFIPVGMSICPSCITTPFKRETLIDEIFLLYNDGRLIKHHTRRLRPAVDEKIFSSMLVAVQDFVKDSYGYEEGALDEMKFGDYRILIGRGTYIIIAAIVSGDDIESLKVQLRKAINELERAYQEVLINWDGNMDAIAGVNRFIEYLIIGEYA
jgi:hypothetical protein